MPKLSSRRPQPQHNPVLHALHDLSHQIHDLEHKVDTVIAQGVQIMKANEQVLAFLDKLDTYTNALAASQETQTAKIAEIAADIDRLIAENAGLDPAVVARLEAASAGLESTVAFEEAQAATLTAIAAKDDEPLPPPVEPPVEPQA